MQSQKAVTAYFSSKQLLPFGFAKRCFSRRRDKCELCVTGVTRRNGSYEGAEAAVAGSCPTGGVFGPIFLPPSAFYALHTPEWRVAPRPHLPWYNQDWCHAGATLYRRPAPSGEPLMCMNDDHKGKGV